MASVHLQRGKPNWFCHYTDSNGIRRCRSTGKNDKQEALQICSQWEKGAKNNHDQMPRREQKKKIMIGRTEVTSTGATFPPDLTKEEWLAFEIQLNSILLNRWFWTGEALLGLEKQMAPLSAHDPNKVKLRRLYRSILASIKRANANRLPNEKVVTAKQLKTVAERIPPAVRHAELSWEHHKAVSNLTDHASIVAWLRRAKEHNFRPGELYRMVRLKSLA